jgi:hypothetical protein
LLADDDNPRRFERAAVRWASRYCRELPDVEPAEAQAVVGLALMLGRSRWVQASHALALLLDPRSQLPAGEMLLRPSLTKFRLSPSALASCWRHVGGPDDPPSHEAHHPEGGKS